MTKDQLNDLITGLQDDDLRVLRAIINGKLGKRAISAEAQAKMQAARALRALPTIPTDAESEIGNGGAIDDDGDMSA